MDYYIRSIVVKTHDQVDLNNTGQGSNPFPGNVQSRGTRCTMVK